MGPEEDGVLLGTVTFVPGPSEPCNVGWKFSTFVLFKGINTANRDGAASARLPKGDMELM